MKTIVKEYLRTLNRQTVQLSELEVLCSSEGGTYEMMAEIVLELEHNQTLIMIKAQGRNGKKPSLAFQYRINKSDLKNDLQQELQLARLQLHPAIQLDSYYRLTKDVWLADLPFIKSIHVYLDKLGFPTIAAPAPERSFALVGDEKWINEQDGEQLLKRIGLWETMKVLPVADPLMFAINPSRMRSDAPVHFHLIVENKTTYYGLLHVLQDVSFTSLIYGCGKKIIRSIGQFPLQLPLPDAKHRFYYFGDIDHAGIGIWHAVNEQAEQVLGTGVQLALPFYTACLASDYQYGKQSQHKEQQALAVFLSHFTEEGASRICACLDDGGYFPQETLSASRLSEIWRTSEWMP